MTDTAIVGKRSLRGVLFWHACLRDGLRRIRKLEMSRATILVVDDFLRWGQFVLAMSESDGVDSSIIYFAADGLEASSKSPRATARRDFNGHHYSLNERL